MMALVILMLACAGFAGLALAMDRPHRQVLQHASSAPRWAPRLGGIAGLALSFAACVADAGWATGAILWLGVLTAGAVIVACLLTWRAHWLRPLARLLEPARRQPGRHS